MIGRFSAVSGLLCCAAILAAMRPDPLPVGDQTTLRQEAKPAGDGSKAQEAPPKSTESTQDDPSPSETGTAEQVLEEIMSRRPQKPLIPPDSSSATSRDEGRRRARWPEGWQLVSRAGRIVQEGKDWIFVFDSDHPDRPEPPIKLLPNLKLESMVRETRAAAKSPVYIVSGEVSVYFGENYLLPRLALRKPESGNLSK